MLSKGRQIAAARALLGWSQHDLAKAADLHVNAISYWEKHQNIPPRGYSIPVACHRIQIALLEAGVIAFIKPTVGVRLVGKQQFPDKDAQARARVMGCQL